jgi:hypothetical protein
MWAVCFGIALAVATFLGLMWLPTELARGAVSILLTLIAAIYMGFALASHGRLSVKKQVCACAVFVLLALLGLGYSGWFSVMGLGLHGGWDLLHHRERGHGVIPGWYPHFCAVYDWGLALFVALGL